MKCNPTRWLWGLPLLAMWIWLTVLSEQARIQTDLTVRSQAALAAAGVDWASTDFDGRDGQLTGRAVHSADPVRARKIVDMVWGVRTVDTRTQLIDKVDNYLWSASLSQEGVLLTGNVPDQDIRNQILGRTKTIFPDHQVRDQMMLARGVPEKTQWLGGIEFGLRQLKLLQHGKLEMRELGLVLSGEARSYAGYKGLKAALRSKLPKGITILSADITPPSVSAYRWMAEKSATQLVLSGYVPSEVQRERLFELAKSKFPKFAIVDRLELASGVTADWVTGAELSLDQLAMLTTGTAELNNRYLTIRGEAPSEEIADDVHGTLAKSLPQSFRFGTDISFPEPLPPLASPYTTNVTVDDGEVQLTGYVPTAEARSSLVGQIEKLFSGRSVVDKLELGSGEPDGWQSCIMAGVNGLGRLGRGTTFVIDRRLVVRGGTRDDKLAEALPAEIRAAANRSCDSEVEIKLDRPPEPKLTWRARHSEDNQLTLEGELPSSQAFNMILEAAREQFPGASIADKTTIVITRNADKWTSVAMAGLKLLSRLRSGEAELSHQTLTLSGTARDTAVAAAVKDYLEHTITKGYTGRSNVEVRSDAMIWAERQAERKEASEAAADADDAADASTAPAVDADAARRQAEAEAAEAAREEAELAAAAEAARRRAEEAAAEAERQRIEEERRQAEALARAQVEAEARRREQDGVRRKAEEAARIEAEEAKVKRRAEADKCQDLLRSAYAEGVIRFAFASATLDRRSFATLNRLVKIVNSCPSFAVEIEGHTDSKGNEESNRILSERRAQSVVDYLTANGVASDRLIAVGYGETRPVASNDTSANRAKNRRIEFAVR